MTTAQRWNSWHIITQPARNGDGWFAFAKRDPFVSKPFNPILEPGDLWFTIAPDEATALAQIELECERQDGAQVN